MSKKSAPSAIKLRGVRHNNLKNFDLDLPLHKLIVVTGLSGSGKSSLAFDTLFAEGQRRYIETFSPYARQFFDRMDKPQVDSIEGIPPSIAIEQRNSVKSTRSTVGTMTEICDYMKLLWPRVAQLYCRQCGRPVRKDSPQNIFETIASTGTDADSGEYLITFNLPISEKLSFDESLTLISQQGYQRLLLENEILRLEDAIPKLRDTTPKTLDIVQDRVKPTPKNRSRFIEACEQAYHFGKGKLALRPLEGNGSKIGEPQLFSNRLHCAQCDIDYREPSPALFSFNNPLGACPACKGFGRVITIDYNLALPDRTKTLAGGAVKPWQGGQSAECQDDMVKFCKIRKVPMDVPFQDLPQKWQDWVINGDTDYGKDSAHQWPKAWYGIKGYFRWLESKSYKMHVRVLLSRYRAYKLCPDCHGKRFQPDALLYQVNLDPKARASAGTSLIGERLQSIRDEKSKATNTVPSSRLTLADFYLLSIREASKVIERIASQHHFKPTDPLGLIVNEVSSRLGYLNDVGLAYLTLDRPTRSLSGGETERVNLTTCLGTRLVNTLFVLDEPSVGLHPRDTEKLIHILEQLRDAGNTVVVVEHEASVMRAADQIIDIGPGHGMQGGQVVFQGPYAELLKSKTSLTGRYLSRREEIEVPARRFIDAGHPMLTISNANVHNLKDLTVKIPLNRFVCLTGVSGSGKTTLTRDILLPLLSARLSGQANKAEAAETEAADNQSDDEDTPEELTGRLPQISGYEAFGRVVLVDQSTLGKTPRSNPAVYIGAFDDIRETFAQSELARQRGLNASAFSFNSSQGQCERCRGAGFEKIEMQFLSDVFIRCPDCNGRRYRAHILEIKLPGVQLDGAQVEWSIADLLEASVDDAITFLSSLSDSRQAKKACASLELLQRVGLGYLHLGQPINTLSGGESQRLKLVRHLAEFTQASGADTKPTLFVFDEPTTGLHFDDVRVLLKVFHDIVENRHSVLIIEHNLDVIKSADWVIDLGPEAGTDGGLIVAEGTPEQVAAVAESHTGQALRGVLVAKHEMAKPSAELVAQG